MKPVTDLGKPSILGVSSLFANINIVIADVDRPLALLVKRILFALGCKQIFIVQDGIEVLQLMQEEPIDIVITEWDMKSMTGIELALHLRQSLDSPNRMVPIIMLTARMELSDIEEARNAGVTEYMIKPFSPKTLLERVHAIVEKPRNFIICKNYIGPDRRRMSSMTPPQDPNEPRVFYPRRQDPIPVSKDILRQVITDDLPRMVMPDYTLKKKIGFEVPPELLTSDAAVEQTQEVIGDAQEEFMKTLLKDVQTMEESFHAMVKNPDSARKMMIQIQRTAYSIDSHAGTFGYTRASEVAGMLYKFCRKDYDKNNKYHVVIIEKHVQTISVIFANQITGDGGEIGSELVKDLSKLTYKYMKRRV